jgi:kumamolisin
MPRTKKPAKLTRGKPAQRPLCRSYCHRLPRLAARAAQTLTPVQVAQLYGLPKVTPVKDAVIGILSLGGGYDPADITAYFAELGLPAPQITVISVDGATPETGSDADVENCLDIQVSAAVYSYCTGRPAQLLFAAAPNTNEGFADGLAALIARGADVISISWGTDERSWGSGMEPVEAQLAAAVAAHITVCPAAGDTGSSDSDQGNNVDFPASSPHALGCGGTRLVGTGSTITAETVWNDSASSATGGGYSAIYARPPWQTITGNVERGVPDVAGNADPVTGYVIRVNGQDEAVGGTSAVAPLWAGLLAALTAAKGSRLGFVAPLLYQHAEALRDVTVGNNGAWRADTGWDPCTGLGTPNGPALLAALVGAPDLPPPVPNPPPPPAPPPAGVWAATLRDGMARVNAAFARVLGKTRSVQWQRIVSMVRQEVDQELPNV